MHASWDGAREPKMTHDIDMAQGAVGLPKPPAAPQKRVSLNERLTNLRYAIVPDRVIGELLSKKWIDNAVGVVFLALVVIVFATLIPSFFNPENVGNLARELGEFGLVALGLMVVMVGGGIDLSVGSNFALGNILTLLYVNVFKLDFGLTLVAVVVSCGLVGAVNGVLVGYLRLRAFLTTLATLIVVRELFNLILLAFPSETGVGLPLEGVWDFAGLGSVLGVPVSMVVMAVVASVLHLVLSRSRLGWHLLAVGGSRRSAHNVGIHVRRTICGSYIVCGMLCGLSGFLYTTRLGSAGANSGVGLEVAVLTAVVLGGNSLGGGRGSVAKALLGATSVIIITNGAVRLGLVSGAASLLLGLLLLLAVAVDIRWVKHKDKILAKAYVSPTYRALPALIDMRSGSGTPYAVNNKLANVELIGLGEVEGPEDVIFDRHDNLYTGERHGAIIRFLAPDYKRWEVFAHIGGHPLGMAFDPNDNLYSCVGGMGLYRVSPQGKVELATDETNRTPFSIIDDSRLRLADDCDIAPDGKVYFSEATVRYELHAWAVDCLESRGNGRLICYDPEKGSTRTVGRNLIFPNGVCVAHDGQSVIFAESWGPRIQRYWIDGPKKGRYEVVINNMPGYPDNINRSSDGAYWCAIMGVRTPALDISLRMPGFRRRMATRLPQDEWLFPNINTGCVIKFNDQGEVLDVLWDAFAANHPMITSMREHKGYLYLGGVSNNRIGRIKLDGADPFWSGPEGYWGRR
jgi:ribose transport system permease protein